MFEKEANEYATVGWDKSQDPRDVFTPRIDETKFNDWRNGAEFGYNKANEWHYCKDELPDHNGQFYVALKDHTETFILNYDYNEDEDDENKMVWLDDDGTNFDDEVYAWREKLKAPKENE